MAFAARDDWTGCGIARQLIALAASDAADRGIAMLGCDVLTDNRRCQSMLERLGMRFGFIDGCLSARLRADEPAAAARLAPVALAA